MKAFTDLQQSKKLAKILPLESANTIWDLTNPDLPTIRAIPYKDSDYENKYLNIIPAWSLAALYNILPNTEYNSTTLSRGGWKIEPPKYVDTWFCEYEDGDDCTRDITVEADNPVDACYEMILKLHELKML